MSASKVNRASKELLIYTLILFILLLVSINIKNYLAPKKVLGTEITINEDEKFWQDFLNKNPNYIPGWIEIGRIDKVTQIDPNYQIESSR